MAEKDETNKKRKNTCTSSVSDYIISEENDTRDKNEGKKATQKKRKSKVGELIEEHNEEKIEITGCYKELQKELQEINKQLNNVMKR